MPLPPPPVLVVPALVEPLVLGVVVVTLGADVSTWWEAPGCVPAM